MIAGFDPDDIDFLRQLVGRHILGTAERVARALDDQRGRAKLLEVLDASSGRISRRMKRVAEAYQARDAGLVGDHARDPAAHRFAADEETSRIAQLCDNAAP